MLPVTFDSDPGLRISKAAIGILAVAILAAGFALTGLLTFAVKAPIFHADNIFLPSLISCAIGLLTILYDFIISSRYVWNTPALLLIIAAAISTAVYGGLLIFTHRRIRSVQSRGPSLLPPAQQHQPERPSREGSLWQDPAYYDNYIRNMFPTSAHQPAQPTGGYDPNSITEEEMQRQQMLMLLLNKEPMHTPDSSTFRIDWQGQEQEDLPPAHGYYAPNVNSPTSAYPLRGITRQFTNEQLRQPWDGVWRGPAPALALTPTQSGHARDNSMERREQRRREIEMGR